MTFSVMGLCPDCEHPLPARGTPRGMGWNEHCATCAEAAKPDKSWDKIRLKHAPKQYKRGPGPTGADRLRRQVNSLLLASSRLERKQGPDAPYARALHDTLKAFVTKDPR